MDDYTEKWEKEVLEPTIKNRPERQEKFTNLSEMDIERIYLPDPGSEYKEKLGLRAVSLNKDLLCPADETRVSFPGNVRL